MITKGLEDKLLSYMYKRHISSQGYGVGNLKASKLHILGYGLEREIPEILVTHEGMKKYLVVDAASELQKKGYVEFSNDNAEFWLTEAGYRRAEQGWVQKVVGYLNKNPGLIALLALIISIIALFFKAK